VTISEPTPTQPAGGRWRAIILAAIAAALVLATCDDDTATDDAADVAQGFVEAPTAPTTLSGRSATSPTTPTSLA
jgi:hypothetical protein